MDGETCVGGWRKMCVWMQGRGDSIRKVDDGGEGKKDRKRERREADASERRHESGGRRKEEREREYRERKRAGEKIREWRGGVK